MRWIGMLLAAGLTLASSSAGTDPAWNGPGWYVVAYQDAVVLWSGPYASEEDCELAKPPDNVPPDFGFSCTFFDQAPEQ
ncbi:MAG TPA: hypothetical protein VGC27_04995 [Rhizomicrobium sp.]